MPTMGTGVEQSASGGVRPSDCQSVESLVRRAEGCQAFQMTYFSTHCSINKLLLLQSIAEYW